MPLLLAENEIVAAPPLLPQILIVALLLVLVVIAAGGVVNLNKMLRGLTGVRRRLEESDESGVRAQLQEAVVQLQSMAVSLDRVAMRCDAIEAKIDAVAAKGLGAGDSGLGEAVAALREGIDQLRTPVGEIRDLMGKTEVDRLADEVKRTLYSMSFDQVVIRTDLASLVGGEGKAHVEVSKAGVKSKGYLVLRGGSVVETKISPTYEMFP